MGKEGKGICLKKPSTKSLPKHLLAVWQMAGVRHREKEFTKEALLSMNTVVKPNPRRYRRDFLDSAHGRLH